jgi:hypothetical protein
MKLIFSEELDNKTSSGYVLDDLDSNIMEGGSPLKELAVPAGLFFLQQAFDHKTPSSQSVKDEGVATESLYDRLLSLVDDSSSESKHKVVTRKTKKKMKGGNKERKSKTKTKKNN